MNLTCESPAKMRRIVGGPHIFGRGEKKQLNNSLYMTRRSPYLRKPRRSAPHGRCPSHHRQPPFSSPTSRWYAPNTIAKYNRTDIRCADEKQEYEMRPKRPNRRTKNNRIDIRYADENTQERNAPETPRFQEQELHVMDIT